MPNSQLEFTETEKQLIKDAQLARVRGGSDMMIIHLGKTVLGQVETHRHQVEAIPFSDKSLDELYGMLEQRAADRVEEKLIEGLSVAMMSPPSPIPPVSEEIPSEAVFVPSVNISDEPLAQALNIVPAAKPMKRTRKGKP
jgi:hypothetical protein